MHNNQSILIYTDKITPRVKYVFNLVLNDILGISFVLTTRIEEFEVANEFKFSYSKNTIASSPLHFTAHGLLFESGIKDKFIEVHSSDVFKKYFFKVSGGSIPFDMFSAIFFLVSRYEEYLPHKTDQYNRFEVESSIAYQYDFLETPLINKWIEELKNNFLTLFSGIQLTEHKYSYISTIDIDNAYKYYYKGIMRTLGGYLRDGLKWRKKELIERTRVLFNVLPDPFDSYAVQLAIQKKYKLNVICFFLMGDYGLNDKNHPANNFNFQKLIKHIADYCKIGIHPSFKSNEKSDQLKIEVARLSRITHKEIKNSRQHFSILKFPDTYNRLLETGITDDYSMGYANYNGFRASICTPFYWYNLDTEVETTLRVHPYMIGEVVLKFKNNATEQTALQYAKPIIDEVKKYNGQLITIFHNDVLGTMPEWKNWYRVYDDIAKEAMHA